MESINQPTVSAAGLPNEAYTSSAFLELEREERHPDDGPVRLGVAEVAIVGMGRVGTGAVTSTQRFGKSYTFTGSRLS